MDYKQKYEEALNKAKEELQCCGDLDCDAARQIFRLFPELKESEDERIRKAIISIITFSPEAMFDRVSVLRKDTLAWLEKQGDNNKWKPSKDEMDALYGLAYITNKMDDKKDKAITKLYQDLKREFFNGASYENMFPLSSIDSSINIEKQGENTYNKELSELLHKVVCKFINSPDIPYSEREKVSKKIIPYVEQLENQGEEKVYSVWVGGSEINDYYLTEKEAKKLAREYKENGYDDVIIEKQGEQKIAWSEEDERTFNNIIEEIRPFGECPDYPTDEDRKYYYGRTKMIDWLKSLKDRIN